MTGNRRPRGLPEPVAGNGLIDRRALIGRGIAFAGAMTGAGATGAAAEPLADAPWSLEMGAVTPALQTPSRFEKHVVRSRGVAVLMVTLLALAAFAGLSYMFGSPLVTGITDLANKLPAYVSSAETGRGWLGHLVQRYHDEELPAELTEYIAARKRYDYAHHGRAGSENAEFVTDEVVDRFCVLGTPEQVRARLGELRDLGVQQFNIYSMVDEPRALISSFGREIIPAFR